MNRLVVLLILILITLSAKYVQANEDLRQNLVEQQVEVLNLPEIIEELSKEGEKIIPDFNPNALVAEISKGNLIFDSKSILNRAEDFFMKEVNKNLGIVVKIVILAILCAVLTNLQTNFSGAVGEIGFYACYLLLISLIIVGFKDAIGIGQKAILDMVKFMQAIIPTYITLLVSMGNFTSSTVLYPVIMFVVQVISTIVETILVPVVFFIAVLSIISNVSNRVQISKFAGFMKTVTIWVMGFILTLFVGVITLESSLAATIDGVTSKAAKFTVSKSIPVIGQVLSDAADTVLGCSLVIKNSVGVVGVILVLSIILVPIIKMLALIIIYKFTAGLIEPISDMRFVNCLNELGGIMTLLFSIVLAVSFMFIVALTALMRAGNIAVMIR